MSGLIKKIEHALNASESNLMTDVLNDCLQAINDDKQLIEDLLCKLEGHKNSAYFQVDNDYEIIKKARLRIE